MSSASGAADQGPQMIRIAQQFNEAWNSGDVEAVMSFFTDSPTVRIVPPPAAPAKELYSGTEEVREWVSRTLSLPFRVEAGNYRTLGAVVTWDARFPLEGQDAPDEVSEAVFEGGKIKEFVP